MASEGLQVPSFSYAQHRKLFAATGLFFQQSKNNFMQTTKKKSSRNSIKQNDINLKPQTQNPAKQVLDPFAKRYSVTEPTPTLEQARIALEFHDWNSYLKVSGVTTVEQLKLLVLFRMLHRLSWDIAHRARDNDYKQSLHHQQAVWEKATEKENELMRKTGLR